MARSDAFNAQAELQGRGVVGQGARPEPMCPGRLINLKTNALSDGVVGGVKELPEDEGCRARTVGADPRAHLKEMFAGGVGG